MELLGDITRRILVEAQRQADNRARVTRHHATAALNKALTSTSYNELNQCEDVMCEYQLASGARSKAKKALADHDAKLKRK